MIGWIPVLSFGAVANDTSTIGTVYHRMEVHDDVEQGKITGIVIDEHNQPVDFASVSLVNVNDSSFIAGAVTDKSGAFEIPCVLDRVIVKVSCVGYSTISRIYESGNIGEIHLHENVKSLQDVVVKGNRKIFSMTSEGLVTNVAGTILSEAGTANDIIAQVPSVYGSKGNYSVYGKGAAVIYINGKKLLDNNELDRLNSKDIISVTLDNNPGSKYDATVRAVILIKTVKKQGEGLSGNLYAMYNQGHYGSFGEGVDLNWRKHGLDIFGSVDYSMSHSYQHQKNDKTIWKDGNTWSLYEDYKAFFKMRANITSNLGFNYDFNKNHSIGVNYSANYIPKTKFNRFNGQDVEYNNDRQETILYDNKQYNKNTFRQFVNAYYTGKLGDWSVAFNNDLITNTGKTMQNVGVSSDISGENEVNTYQKATNVMFATKLVAAHPIGKGKFEVGYELTFTDHKQNYTNVGLPIPSSDDQIKENNYAGFASVDYLLGTAKFMAGLRYEHTTSDYYKAGALIGEQSRNYDKLFPNAGVSFHVGKVSLNLNYAMKIRRPSYSELSSNVQYDDAFTYETGNPNLVPEITHDVTLSTMYKWMYMSMSYQHLNDARINVYNLQDGDGTPLNIYKRINYPNLNVYTVTLSLTPKFGIWSPRLSMTLTGQDFKMSYNGKTLKHTNPILYTKLYNSFSLPCDFLLTADIWGHTSGDRAIIHEKPSYQLDMGIVKKLHQWTFHLRATDIFRTARNSMDFYGDSMIQHKWNYSDTQAVCLTVRYRFNSTNSHYKGTGAGSSEMIRLF